MCPATGLCVAAAAGDPKTPDPTQCLAGYTVRQGWFVNLPMPVTKVEQVTRHDTWSDLQVHDPVQLPDGSIVVSVWANHGAVSGDYFNETRRLVNIETNVDGEPVRRQVLVVVSHITVSGLTATPPGNDDTNDGTLGRPFLTLETAARASGAGLNRVGDVTVPVGDTIELINYSDPSPGGTFCATNPSVVHVPDKVSLIGRDMLPTQLATDLRLDGDATLSGLELTGPRLVIQTAGSSVAIQDVLAHCGITIDSAASTTGSSFTELSISGVATNLWDDSVVDSPLAVHAVGASVTIADGANILMTTTPPPGAMPSQSVPNAFDTMYFDGGGQKLTILGGTHIANMTATGAAIHLAKQVKVYMEGGDVSGSMVVEDPGSILEIEDSSFDGSPGAAIQFSGQTLTVTNSAFASEGIIQDGAGSTATITGMTAKNFRSFGYHLTNGTATITNSDFSHTGAPLLSTTGPWPLFVDAASASGSTITSSTTKYDAAPALTPCSITGPADLPGLYSITNMVTIAFH
jgi:hypothetical protein